MITIKIDKKFGLIKNSVNKNSLKRSISSNNTKILNISNYDFNEKRKVINSIRTISIKKILNNNINNSRKKYNKFNNKCAKNFKLYETKTKFNNFDYLKDNKLKYFFFKKNTNTINNINKIRSLLYKKLS